MENPRRFATVAAVLCEAAFVACLAGFGSVQSGNNEVLATDERQSASLSADAPRATAISSAVADSVDMMVEPATVAELVAPTDTPATPDEPKAIVEAALTDSSQLLLPETPPVQVATPSATDTPASPDEPKAIVEAALTDSSQLLPPQTPPVQVATPSATDTPATPDEPKAIVEAALTDSSQLLPPETPPVQVATASATDAILKNTRDAVGSIDILGECLVADPCIDQYLWALYQRTPKEDSIKVEERRKVTVKRKGKTVTVTKTFTKLVDENFAWKDPKAAEKAGISMMDYVIGGMDRSFKLKLFYALHAAEEAGLAPGITSAFRDDYRQSIASGLKAASDRSYHGGSSHGGYGHGLAADIVSVKGDTRTQRCVSTENLWKWIDTHEKEFGIGRPYLDRDPPHVAPIDGKEFASHRGTKTVHAASGRKERKAGLDESAVKRTRTPRSS